MEKSKGLIGFRQYFKSSHSQEDLLQIIRESQNYKNLGFDFMVALCGENPYSLLAENNMEKMVNVYDYARLRLTPTQLIKRFIPEYHNGREVKIIYYSNFPEGLTYPIDLFSAMSSFMNYDHLAVSDSDFQIPFEEIIRSFKYHIKNSNQHSPSLTFPNRVRRSLDAHNYPINRWAMEDIENLYVYFLSNIKFLDMKLDIQSGLFFTNRLANILLDFNKVGKWVGTLHLAISLLREKNVLVNRVDVQTANQHESTINFGVQCDKIDELYDYYLIPMENIIRISLDNPRKYLMSDWCENFSIAEIKAILENIYQEYLKHKHPALETTKLSV